MMSGEICKVIVEISYQLYIFYDFPRSLPRGPSPFPIVEKDQKTTAASDAMKGSGLARLVIAAPAKAEDRLGRVCAGGILLNNFICFLFVVFKN
jgi:hypothetical protein